MYILQDERNAYTVAHKARRWAHVEAEDETEGGRGVGADRELLTF